LLLCSSYLPLGVPNWTVTYIINTVPHQARQWAKGISHLVPKVSPISTIKDNLEQRNNIEI
jgi:hypothetical protein